MTTYQQVTQAIGGYFSNQNAADVFLARQCEFHLSKKPDQITPNDLWNLANWVMISGALQVGKQKAEEMSDKIREIRKQTNQLAA